VSCPFFPLVLDAQCPSPPSRCGDLSFFLFSSAREWRSPVGQVLFSVTPPYSFFSLREKDVLLSPFSLFDGRRKRISKLRCVCDVDRARFLPSPSIRAFVLLFPPSYLDVFNVSACRYTPFGHGKVFFPVWCDPLLFIFSPVSCQPLRSRQAPSPAAKAQVLSPFFFFFFLFPGLT